VKPADFARVTCPVYAATYYQDEAHRDPTIRVWAVRWMMGLLGTPGARKRYQEFPLAADDVIACDLMSKDWMGVRQGTWDFLEQTLGWRPL